VKFSFFSRGGRSEERGGRGVVFSLRPLRENLSFLVCTFSWKPWCEVKFSFFLAASAAKNAAGAALSSR